MITTILDFIVAYFSHLNVKKVIGGLIVLAGMAIISYMGAPGDPEKAVLIAIAGIIVGGIGFVIILFDMAKDKAGANYSEVETLTRAYKQDPAAKQKITNWDMHQNADKTKKNGL